MAGPRPGRDEPRLPPHSRRAEGGQVWVRGSPVSMMDAFRCRRTRLLMSPLPDTLPHPARLPYSQHGHIIFTA
eukprot:202093-Prymnesium_polylepis.1